MGGGGGGGDGRWRRSKVAAPVYVEFDESESPGAVKAKLCNGEQANVQTRLSGRTNLPMGISFSSSTGTLYLTPVYYIFFVDTFRRIFRRWSGSQKRTRSHNNRGKKMRSGVK